MTMNFNSLKKAGDFTSGQVGSVADGAPKYARSYAVVLTASQDVKAGVPLIFGDNPEVQVRPTVTGDVIDYHTFAGMMLLDPTKPKASSGGLQYSNGDQVAVLKLGVMNCEVAQAVTAGEAVVAQVNGGGLRSSHATGSLATGEFFLPMCRWETSAPAGGVAQMSVGMSLAHREITGSL